MTISTYLWQSHPDDLRVLGDRAREWLPEPELQRAERFRHQGSRQLYLAGRVLLRRLLAERLGLPEREVPLVLGEKGKPGLPEGTDPVIHFNLAHSAECLMLAISGQHPLGIDLEHCRVLDPMNDLAQRIMHPDEYQVFINTEGPAQTEFFFRIWVAKEAFVKWCGAGIGYGLQSICIDPPNQQVLKPSGQVRLQYLHAPPGFMAAVAYPQGPAPAVVRENTLNSLFDRFAC